MTINWAVWLPILEKLAPIALAFIPGIPPQLIPAIVQGMAAAEQLPNVTGATKKAHVVGSVQTAIATTPALHSLAASDPTPLITAVSQGIDTVIASMQPVLLAHPPPVAG